MVFLDEQKQYIIQDLVHKVVDEEGFELVDFQLKRAKAHYLLKVFIDIDEGVKINDCERVSKRLSSYLDEIDFIPGPYILEVSSPGLDRPLREEKDFIRFQGHKVNLYFFNENKEKQTIEGNIFSLKDNVLIIEGEKGERYEIPFCSVQKASLVIDF